MAIKFNGDLSTGDLSQWDAETDAGFNGAYSGGYYVVSTPTGSTASFTAFLEEDVTESFAGHFKFTFKPTLNNTFNGVRAIRVLELLNSTTGNLNVTFRSNGTNKELTQVIVTYRNSSNSYGAQETVDLGDSASPFTAATDSTVKVYARMSNDFEDADGVLKLWVDDVLLVDITDLDWSSTQGGHFDKVRFGCVSTDINPPDGNEETWSFKDFQYSNNGVYDTATSTGDTYYLDGVNGTELGTGTLASPFKSAFTATSALINANVDVLKLVDNGTTPHRLVDIGLIRFPASGTANNNYTIDGQGAVVTGAQGVEGSAFSGPDGNGEYSYQISTSAIDDPQRIYVCTSANWTSSGIDAINPNIVGRTTAIRNTKGTVTSLAAGEYGVSTGTIYYKPQSGETMADLHFEIPRRANSVDGPIDLNTDYFIAKNIIAYCGLGSTGSGACISNSANGANSYIYNCECYEGCIFCLKTTNAILYKCTAAYVRGSNLISQTFDNIYGTGGSGDIIGCISHHAVDDGIACQNHSGDVIGCVSHTNGFSGSSMSGIEMTGGSTGGVYHCTVVGNAGSGIIGNDATVATTMRNNISAYNASHGITVNDASHAASDMDYNCSYGNGGSAFRFFNPPSPASPSNTVTTDPLFTSVDATTGIVDGRNDNYTLQSGSPCKEATDGSSIIDHYWGTGPRPECIDNAVPDRRASMGAYQE